MFTLDQAGRRAWEVEVRPPPPVLRPWVEHVVLDRRPAGEHGPWRIVPDPGAHVLAAFGRVDGDPSVGAGPAEGGRENGALGPLLRASLVGARRRFVDADAGPRGVTVGVRLRPGALAALLRVPARELTDRSVALDAALGSGACTAVSRLDEAGTPEEALDALVGVVSRLAAGAAAPDWRVGAAARALAAGVGRGGPGAVAGATGMAPRTLRAVAAAEVGLSPGRWVRIHRLFGALCMNAEAPRQSWGRIGARAGYHDASHLTREFRTLLGETPTAWARRRSPMPQRRASTANRRK